MTVVIRLTWGTLKADVIVRADTAMGLFLVDAPETLLQTGVNHFPCVCCCHPVCSASFHGCGSCTDSLPVIKTDRFQALVVSITPRMVNVEPRCPLCDTWRHREEDMDESQRNRGLEGREGIGHNQEKAIRMKPAGMGYKR